MWNFSNRGSLSAAFLFPQFPSNSVREGQSPDWHEVSLTCQRRGLPVAGDLFRRAALPSRSGDLCRTMRFLRGALAPFKLG